MKANAFLDPPSFAVALGLKFTDADAYAFEQAARLVRRIPGAMLQVVHVFETPLSRKDSESMRDHLKLYAHETAISLGGLGPRRVGIHLRVGEPAHAIAQFASDVEAGLIVIGADLHPIKDWLVVTTAERLVELAPCAVLVAGPMPMRSRAAPTIEPPCPDCVATRFASRGAEWWCARHAEHGVAGHTFSYQPDLPFETHDSQLGPTGV